MSAAVDTPPHLTIRRYERAYANEELMRWADVSVFAVAQPRPMTVPSMGVFCSMACSSMRPAAANDCALGGRCFRGDWPRLSRAAHPLIVIDG